MKQLGMPRSGLDTPALLIDLDVLDSNINTMATYFSELEAEGLPVRLRPHTKVHKSPIIAKRQMGAGGAHGITCQKVSEAEAMVAAGITEDILISNQVVGRAKIDHLMDLCQQADIMVCVDNDKNIAHLSTAAAAAKVNLGVLVELDVGLQRCGVPSTEEAARLARLIDSLPSLSFEGLQAYEGHLGEIVDEEKRRVGVQRDLAILADACNQIESAGLPLRHVEAGGTTTYHLTARIPRVTAIQAGAYVFQDGHYMEVIDHFDFALSVLSTVISRPVPTRAVLDIGMKSLAADGLAYTSVKTIGGAKLEWLSEEHGVLALSGDATSLQVGDKIELIPGHCGTTVNLYDEYYVMHDDRVEEIWEIAGRGKFR